MASRPFDAKEKERASLQQYVFEKLAGQLYYGQSQEDREEIILRILTDAKAAMPAEEKKRFLADILSYEPIDEEMKDPGIEDIMISALNPVYIFHQSKGMLKTKKKFETLEQLDLFVRKLLAFSGKTEYKPINDLHLITTERANVVHSPLGPQITIRKFRQTPLSIIDLIRYGTMTYELAAQLWLYSDGLMIKPANLMIGGMPSAGKTTMLNAMFSFFPTQERLVVIEDTMELNTINKENCARLECTEDMTLRDLVRNTLRMRPDRIIIGEVRGEEAIDLMTAMNIGKICMCTIHASTTREIVMRLENMPMNVPTDIIPMIDAFIVMKQINFEGKIRRVISQVSETGGVEKKVLLSDLSTFDFKTGKLRDLHPSVVYRDRLAEAAGIQPTVVMEEIASRAKILKSLDRSNIHTITQVSDFCSMYYDNPKNALARLGMEA
ncbi:MAG: ATPase, T2SS/T4P/T4SS family [Candidatus Micrarchaeota archaeon]|nr:ATPase, T2SS/T4P/T4SS family [Candidatus Micrarchaeota archaeon]